MVRGLTVARYHVGMRLRLIAPVAAALLSLSGCGYHTLGAATHLPADIKTLSVPVFANHTIFNGTNTAVTEAVIREFTERTRFRVTPREDADADAVVRGTIVNEGVQPLTFNSETDQSSSFVVTVVASVTVTARDGRVLYANPNYVFREQYQATTNLPLFVQEDPAAVARLSRNFARQFVADLLEGF